jgi:hypothetical protein
MYAEVIELANCQPNQEELQNAGPGKRVWKKVPLVYQQD